MLDLPNQPEYNTKSFKFTVSAFGSTCTAEHQLKVIESFSWLGFDGDIVLRNPEVEFVVVEDFGSKTPGGRPRPEPERLYMGKLVGWVGMRCELVVMLVNNCEEDTWGLTTDARWNAMGL